MIVMNKDLLDHMWVQLSDQIWIESDGIVMSLHENSRERPEEYPWCCVFIMDKITIIVISDKSHI